MAICSRTIFQGIGAMTHTFTTSGTFTKTGAKYLASKVAADLQAVRDHYGQPSEAEIRDYNTELAVLLAEGCVESVEYGFERNDNRVVSLYYEVRTDGSLTDGRSGGVYARADITGAAWFSFLTYSGRWEQLGEDEQQRIEARLPIKRTYGQAPQDGNGYWVTDRSYSSQSVGTQRRTFRPR